MGKQGKVIKSVGDGRDGYRKLVLYGPPGIGKSTTAAKAPRPLILDCAGGVDFIAGDKWFIGTASDLKEAVSFLGGGGHGYLTVIVDGLDALYARMTVRVGDRRKDHLAQQDILHPILETLFGLRLHVIIVINEHEDVQGEGKDRVVSYSFDLPPRTSEILMARADFVARAKRRADTDPVKVIVSCSSNKQFGKARSAELLRAAHEAGNLELATFLSVIRLTDYATPTISHVSESDETRSGDVS